MDNKMIVDRIRNGNNNELYKNGLMLSQTMRWWGNMGCLVVVVNKYR